MNLFELITVEHSIPALFVMLLVCLVVYILITQPGSPHDKPEPICVRCGCKVRKHKWKKNPSGIVVGWCRSCKEGPCPHIASSDASLAFSLARRRRPSTPAIGNGKPSVISQTSTKVIPATCGKCGTSLMAMETLAYGHDCPADRQDQPVDVAGQPVDRRQDDVITLRNVEPVSGGEIPPGDEPVPEYVEHETTPTERISHG